MWEVRYNKKARNAILKRVLNASGYSPNLLLPGSSPNVKLFGADIYGGYPNSKIVWGLEHSVGTETTKKFGKDIILSDRGPYSSDNGIFVQFQGLVGNSGTGAGFESPTDTDPRPGIVGKTVYTLTYRIPVGKPEFMQECSFRVIENNFGPISTAYMSLFLSGYRKKSMVYATNPELMPTGGINLKNVQVNKYFKNTCVKRVYFYQVPFKPKKGKKIYAHTPEGRGRIACIGSPKSNIPFICGYPTNDFIPKNTKDQYTLEITDNQTLPRFGRFQAINYKLINNKKKTVMLSQTGKHKKRFSMIMRYKVLDVSAAPVRVIKMPPRIRMSRAPVMAQKDYDMPTYTRRKYSASGMPRGPVRVRAGFVMRNNK